MSEQTDHGRRAILRTDVVRPVGHLVVGLALMLVLPGVAVQWDGGVPPSAGFAVETFPRSFAAEVAVLVVVSAALALRLRLPLAGLLVAVAGLAVGPLVGRTHLAVFIVFSEALFNGVRHGSRRTSRTLTVLAPVVVVALGGLAFVASGAAEAVVAVLNLSLLVLVPVWWAQEVRHHQDRADAEREHAEQAARVAELDRLAAVTAERNRMARDLHDVIAGQLSGIAIQSEAVLSLPDADPGTLREVLANVRRDSVASLTEMRAMIGLLRADAPADEARTAPAGLAHVGQLLDTARTTGLRVRLDDRRTGGVVHAAAVDLAAYRIVQESLTNAAKHAPGSAVTLTLRHEDGELHVEIDNDLVDGAAPGGGTGTGLVGLGERAAAVGGRIDAGPRIGRWSVRAALPCPGTPPLPGVGA